MTPLCIQSSLATVHFKVEFYNISCLKLFFLFKGTEILNSNPPCIEIELNMENVSMDVINNQAAYLIKGDLHLS